MKKAVTLFLLMAFVSLLSACNTMHGMGQDMENLGDKIKNKASQ